MHMTYTSESAMIILSQYSHLLFPFDRPGLAMPTLSDSFPISGEVDHVASVHDAVPEQMVELQTSPVDRPVMTALQVVEMIAFRRQHCDMLDVSPRQIRTAEKQTIQIYKETRHNSKQIHDELSRRVIPMTYEFVQASMKDNQRKKVYLLINNETYQKAKSILIRPSIKIIKRSA